MKVVRRRDGTSVASGPDWTPDAMLQRLGGDRTLAQELAALFATEYPRMLADVRAAVDSGSGERTRRAAHALKGSVSNFTAGPPAVTALALEAMGREGRLDEARALVDRLGRELAWLASRLAAFAADQPS